MCIQRPLQRFLNGPDVVPFKKNPTVLHSFKTSMNQMNSREELVEDTGLFLNCTFI